MSRLFWLASLSLLLATGTVWSEDWKFDVVHQTKGRPALSGLVVRQTTTDVHLRRVFRRPGQPTVVMEDRVPRSEVARLELLKDDDRQKLVKRLETLAEERKQLAARLQLQKGGKVELSPDQSLTLKPAPWGKDGKGKALAYESTHFRLVSNAREDLVYHTAIQLEQVYAAYERWLPPRLKPKEPTTILLTVSLSEYYQIVRERRLNLLNPAFFDSAKNQVVCGSDLERLAQSLEKARQAHEQLRAELQTRKTELAKLYKDRVPVELSKPMKDSLEAMRLKDKKNDEVFKTAYRRLFQRLFHEAFHAYLAGAVFSDKDALVPDWLNEGLAQIFETALVEAGELNVGHADPERLQRVRAALNKEELLELTALLKAGPRQFQVAHGGDRQGSDRYYLSAWALAFYLTFERPVVGTAALDGYVKALKRGTDPLEAFRTLVGQPLPQFEKEFRSYLSRLRQDGTAAPDSRSR